MQANVFDCKRFGINDGGGIRTVLFIKGCPLRCKWCHNPEGLAHEIRLWRLLGSCVFCKACIKACPQGALCADENSILIDHDKCNLCGACVRECPTGAMKPDAINMSVDEAMSQILRDEVFYGEKGGVTLSGGECTASPEFSLAVLEECRKRGIHTAIETCMHTPVGVMRAFAQATDSVIVDLKQIDPQRHKAVTGVDNALILKNFEYLAHNKQELLVRIPLIPSFTADGENIAGIASFIEGINKNVPVELINYNPMCTGKYDTLRMEFIKDAPSSPLPQQLLAEFAQIVRDHGLKVIY